MISLRFQDFLNPSSWGRACSDSSPSRTWPSSSGRGRVRRRAERPDGRDRRRQVDPRRGGRPAARRPRLARPRPHRRRVRRSSRRSSTTRTAARLLVRREVTAQGRSRAFVNGALVTAGALRELGARLVDLHGQHEHQALLDPRHAPRPARPLRRPRRGRARRSPTPSTRCAGRASGARRRSARAARDSEPRGSSCIEFQLAELDRVQPARRARTRNSRPLRTLLAERRARAPARRRELRAPLRPRRRGAGRPRAGLAAGGGAGRARRRGSRRTSRRATPSSRSSRTSRRSCAATPPASTRRRRGCRRSRTAWPLLERLKRKHGPTLADVIEQAARRSAPSRPALESLGERLADAEADVRAAGPSVYLAAARALSRSGARRPRPVRRRRSSGAAARPGDGAHAVRGAVPRRLAAAAGAVDRRAASTSPSSTSRRTPARSSGPLARIVSGGELSRIMLAIKTLASTDAAGEDAGLRRGGRGHRRAGGRRGRAASCRRSGGTFQVLCITHLPQIAACGGTHFRITQERRGRADAHRRRAARTGPSREVELARMIGGAEVTDGDAGERAGDARPRGRAKANIKRKAKAKGRRRRPAR